jgi:nucleoside-diphosphate-sugar epimerase
MLVDEARKRGAVRVVGDGQQEWPAIHVEDLAGLYVRALDATPGSLVHGVTGTSYRVSDIATAASIAGGAAGRTEPWPLEEARRELGGFADALALHQRISGARTRWTFGGWTPRGPSLVQDLLVGSYAERG